MLEGGEVGAGNQARLSSISCPTFPECGAWAKLSGSLNHGAIGVKQGFLSFPSHCHWDWKECV